MSAFFSKHAVFRTALVATTVSVSPVAAQEAQQPWQIERFGVVMELPGGSVIEDDRHRREQMEFSAIRDGENGESLRMGVRVVTPQIAETLPVQPVQPGFAAFLSRVVDVPLTRTGTVMRIGGAGFRVYSGSGIQPTDDGEQPERALFLITEEPMESGDMLWIGIYSVGLNPEEAARVEANFVSSLALNGASAGGAAPLALLGGLVRMARPDDVELAARRRERREMVQTGPEGGEEPDLLRTAELLRDSTDAVARMTEMRLFELDAITQGLRDGVPVWVLEGSGHPLIDGGRDEDGVGQPTRLELTSICAPGEGPVVLGATLAEGVVDPALLDGMSLHLPDGSTSCGAPLSTAMAALALAYRPSVIEGLDMAPLPPLTAEETTDEDPAESAMEMADETPGAAPADDPAAAPMVAGEPMGLSPLPQPDGTVPEGWGRWERFGIAIAAPPGAGIDSDHARPNRMEFLVEQVDPQTGAEISAGVMIAAPAMQDQMPPLDSPDFVDLLSGWAGMPAERLDDRVTLGGSSLLAFSAAGTRGSDPGIEGRALYLVTEDPLPNGNRPFVVAAAMGAGDATDALIRDIVRSLSLPDPLDWGRVSDIALMDGLGRFAIPVDLSVIDVDSTPGGTNIALGAGDEIDTLVIAERMIMPAAEWLEQRFLRIDRVEQTEFDGIAGQSITGLASFRPDFRRPQEGDEVGIHAVVLDRCLVDGNRIALIAASTAEPLLPDALTTLLSRVALNLPVDAIDCPQGFDPLALAQPPEPTAPEETPEETADASARPMQPPSGVLITPGTGESKDPSGVAPAAAEPQPDPEAQAWATAEAAQGAGEMIAYLQAFPQGAHADAARAWLTARAIQPPDGPPGGGVVSPPPDDDEFLYARAETLGTPQAFWDYLKAYPDGRFAAQAWVGVMMALREREPSPQTVPAPQPVPAPEPGK